MKLSTRLAIAMVGLVLFTALTIVAFSYRSIQDAVLPRALELIETRARLLKIEMESYVNGARADVLGFSASPGVEAIIGARLNGGIYPVDGTAEAVWRERVKTRYMAELASKPAYLQLRIIGIQDDGREIVRVDRSGPGGAIRVVPDDELQAKGDRDYFIETVKLKPREVYVSQIDLNQENGVIEMPHVPVLRIATPLRAADGSPFGILIINVDMRPAFALVRSAPRAGGAIYMVNERGDYLIHPDPNREFGFQLGKPSRIGDDLPELVSALRVDESWSRLTSDSAGGRIAAAVVPLQLADSTRITLIETAPDSEIMAPVNAVRNTAFFAGSVAVLAAIVLALILSRSLTMPLAQMTAAVQAFGRKAPMTVPVAASGEIGVLARTFEHMADEIRRGNDAIETYADRERFYVAAVESSNHAFITTDPDGTITAWNPGAERLFGYSADEAIGRHITIIVPEDRREEGHANGDKIRRLGRVENFETVRVDKNGKRIDVVLDLAPIVSAAGGFIGGVYIARDVTAEKLAQEMFRLAVEASPNGMVMTDRAGTIVMINTEVERLFGYERHELVGQSVDVLVPAARRQHHASQRSAYAKSPETRRMGAGRDLFGCRKDGSEFPVEVGLNLVQARDGLLVLGVIVDISERLHNERLKDEFVSTVSHELRTPLTSIAGSLGLLAGGTVGTLPDPAMRLLKIAYKNSERLVRLINDILDIEKIESGKIVYTLQRVDVHALIEQAVEANRGFAESYGVLVRLDPVSAQTFVRADPDRLLQVITNLLSNAVKFSPRNEEVVISLEQEGDSVRIAVRDHGSGIPEEFKPRVFEKFAQADATDARQKGGTGLGLSIVKQIVLLLGGKVSFDTRAGVGTVFYVELPRWELTADAQPPVRLQEPYKPKVLVCDDDVAVASSIAGRLADANFGADVAMSAKDAVKQAQAKNYHAILVDLMLPDQDGISLIQELRAQPQHENTPIVVISADVARGRDDIRSSSLDILDWLNKPVDIPRLAEVLNRPLARNGNQRSRILHIDDDQDVLDIVANALRENCDVTSVASISEARVALAGQGFDLAVLDLMLASSSGLDLLPDLRDASGDAIPVVLYSARNANQLCAEQVQAAMTKSQGSIDHLVLTLRKHLNHGHVPAPNKREVA